MQLGIPRVFAINALDRPTDSHAGNYFAGNADPVILLIRPFCVERPGLTNASELK